MNDLALSYNYLVFIYFCYLFIYFYITFIYVTFRATVTLWFAHIIDLEGGGAIQVLAILKGGGVKQGGPEDFYPVSEGGAQKSFGPAIFPFCYKL